MAAKKPKPAEAPAAPSWPTFPTDGSTRWQRDPETGALTPMPEPKEAEE